MYYKRCKWKQRLSLFMAMVFLAMSFQGIQVKAIGEKQLGCEDFFTTPSYTVRTFINTQTEQEYHATVIVENTGDQAIESWYLAFETPDEIQTNWDSELIEHKDSTYVFKNDHDMQDIPAHGWISFGYTATYEEEIHTPENIYMPFKIAEISKDSYEWEWKEKADENSASVILTNKTDQDIDDWMVEFDLNGRNDINVTSGELLAHNGNHIIIGNAYYNENLYAEEKVSFRLGWEYSEDEVELKNLKLYGVVYASECKSYVAGEREETVSGNDAEAVVSEEESVEESESETLGEAVESKEPVLEDIDEIFENDTTTVEAEETAVETEETVESEDAVVETEETVESEDAVVETEETVESVEAIVEIKETIEGAGTIEKYEEPPKTTVEAKETADSEERAMESEEIAETAVECEEVAETAVETEEVAETIVESEEITDTVVETEEVTETSVEEEEVVETTVEDEEAVESEETSEENEEAVEEESTEEKASWELYPGLDSDGDDVPDETEISMGWNPYCPDSDNDSMPDGFEWKTIQAYNLQKLTDAENENGKEISERDFITDVISHEDYDHDYMMNRDEYLYGTNPLNSDSDGDGIIDGDEAFIHHYNPAKYDTDDDGMGDGLERGLGMNPVNPDSDGDGVIDGEEITTQTVVLTSDKDVVNAPYLIITGRGDYTQKVKMSIDDTFTPDLESVEEELINGGINFNRILFETSEDLTFEEATICYPFNWDFQNYTELEPYAVAQVNEDDILKPLETKINRYNIRVEASLERLKPVYLMDTRVYYKTLNDAYLIENSKSEIYDGKEYILLDESLGWEEANDYADLMNAKIVSIDSEEEKEFIDGFIERNGTKDQYWIGGKDCDSFTSGNLSLWKDKGITPYCYVTAAENGGRQADGKYYYSYHKVTKSDDFWTDRMEEWGVIVSYYPIFYIEYVDGVDAYGNKITHSELCAYDPNPGNDATVWVEVRDWRYEVYGKIITFGGIGGTSETSIEEKIYLRNTGGPATRVMSVNRCHSEEQTRCVNGEWIRQIDYIDTEKRKCFEYGNNIPMFYFWGDAFNFFKKGNRSGQKNQNADKTGRDQSQSGIIVETDDLDHPCKVYLVDEEKLVELKKSPLSGDTSIDSDMDGVPDLIELEKQIPNWIPQDKQKFLQQYDVCEVQGWTCRSNPKNKDTDYDGLRDDNDAQPKVFDLYIKEIKDTDALVPSTDYYTSKWYRISWIQNLSDVELSMLDKLVFRYLEKMLFNDCFDDDNSSCEPEKELLKRAGRNVSVNTTHSYTAKEIALFYLIDPVGVKWLLSNYCDFEYRKKCYYAIKGYEVVSEKTIDDFFDLSKEIRVGKEFTKRVAKQVIYGKWVDENDNTMTGTLLAYGVGIVPIAGEAASIRDFAYDIATILDNDPNNNVSWIDFGIDGIAVGTGGLSRSIKNIMVIRDSGNGYFILKTTLNLNPVGAVTTPFAIGDCAQSAKLKLAQMDAKTYRDVLLTCETIKLYRQKFSTKIYDNEVLNMLVECQESLEELRKRDLDKYYLAIKKIANEISLGRCLTVEDANAIVLSYVGPKFSGGDGGGSTW